MIHLKKLSIVPTKVNGRLAVGIVVGQHYAMVSFDNPEELERLSKALSGEAKRLRIRQRQGARVLLVPGAAGFKQKLIPERETPAVSAPAVSRR